MKKTLGIIFIVLLILIGGFFLWYFLVYKKKTDVAANNATASSGASVAPTGSTVVASNGNPVVLSLTEKEQTMISGLPFADDSKILTKAVPLKYSNNMHLIHDKQYLCFDPISGTIMGMSDNYTTDTATSGAAVGTRSLTPRINRDVNSVYGDNGIKFKNIIFKITDYFPIFGSTLGALRIEPKYYFQDGSEKVFPYPNTTAFFIDVAYQTTNKQFKYVSKELTQTALNAAL